MTMDQARPLPVVPGTLTPTALLLEGNMTFEEWRAAGVPLLRAGESLGWWIGDWLLYGEENFGSAHREVEDWTGLVPQGLYDAKWVVSKFPDISLRHENLTFSHHREVAAIDDLDAREWLLATAEKGEVDEEGVRRRWSVRRLREEVRALRAVGDQPDEGDPDDEIMEPGAPEIVDDRIMSYDLSIVVRFDLTFADPVQQGLAMVPDALRRWYQTRGVDAEVRVA